MVWVGDKPAPMKWINTWKDKHPDWEFMLWTNEDIFKGPEVGGFSLFVTKRLNWVNEKAIQMFGEQQNWRAVTNIVRFEILYNFGGFMPDADTECLQRVDELFEDDYENYSVNSYHREGIPDVPSEVGSTMALYASNKGTEFAKQLIDGITNLPPYNTPDKITQTGNKYMKLMIKKFNPRIKIFPLHYFVPETPDGWKYQGTDKIYGTHYWGARAKNLKTYEEGI